MALGKHIKHHVPGPGNLVTVADSELWNTQSSLNEVSFWLSVQRRLIKMSIWQSDFPMRERN